MPECPVFARSAAAFGWFVLPMQRRKREIRRLEVSVARA